jgi:hypothetical protein
MGYRPAMGYRIQYATGDGTLRAVVSGKSSLAQAAWIGRDIAAQASREAVRQLLIDVRRLADRVGTLGTLLTSHVGVAQKVAVIDVAENDPYYAFCELAARNQGFRLRCFGDAAAAMRWLRERND